MESTMDISEKHDSVVIITHPTTQPRAASHIISQGILSDTIWIARLKSFHSSGHLKLGTHAVFQPIQRVFSVLLPIYKLSAANKL